MFLTRRSWLHWNRHNQKRNESAQFYKIDFLRLSSQIDLFILSCLSYLSASSNLGLLNIAFTYIGLVFYKPALVIKILLVVK
jgi:hypothetical protein